MSSRDVIAEQLAKGGVPQATVDEYGIDVVEQVLRFMPGTPAEVADVVAHAVIVGRLDGAQVKLAVGLLRSVADLYGGRQ